MVDPLTIIGGVGAAAGIIATVTKTIKYLSDLQTKYSDAEASIRLLIRQLMTIKTALREIQDWIGLNLSGQPRERDLIEAFSTSLEGCKEAMDAMCEEVTRLVEDALAGDKRTMRARYVWNEESMKDHQGRLSTQIQALQLLLSAVQCRTGAEQTALLRQPQNRQIVEKVRDDTRSLRAGSVYGSRRDSHSVLSRTNSSIGGTELEMDNVIINTYAYRQAMASRGHQRARSTDERNRRPVEAADSNDSDEVNRLPGRDVRSGDWSGLSESSDRLSPIDVRLNRMNERLRPYERSVASDPADDRRSSERPRPYERSVASDPPDVSRPSRRPYVHISPASDPFLPYLHLPAANKAVKKKRSFLPSLFTASSTTLLPPDANSLLRAPPNHRRGRRHSDSDIHRSIDLDSNDGRSAPPLVRAAQSGSGIEIEELLDQRVDIESRHSQTRRTALAVASHCGNDDVVAILLQHGANPSTVDATGMTPLHLASIRGHYRVVDYLLKEEVNVDAVGPEKKTALRLAADNGHVEVVDLLLSRRAKVNARDAQNLTALHSAARIGDEDIVNLLLRYNADIEAKDGKFRSALHHASEAGRERVVEILLSKKANIEALGKESMSPLTAACASGSTDVVRLLLQRKASLKHKGDGAMTALHWASFNGHSDVVELLLEKRVPKDPATTNGRTPLHLAVLADNFATAELLLRKGASVEAPCQNGLRPLHYAAECKNADLVQLLLGHNATIEAETRIGKRPLHYAAAQGNLDMIDNLLQRGAAIDARDGAGDRPLCIASVEGNVEVVRLLLSRGAEMRQRYSKGPSHEDSPLCIAAKNGHLAVVEEFVRRGASVRQRDEANWQPLRYAAYFGHPEVVQYLLAAGASISGLDNPGSFGFDLTAERIGFAQNADIDEFRRQSVLMLLHDAETRERESSNSYQQPSLNAEPPRQDAPAEMAGDLNAGYGIPYSSIYGSRPTAASVELPVQQTAMPQRAPTYHRPGDAAIPLPSRPRSPPTYPSEPDSSSESTWNPTPLPSRPNTYEPGPDPSSDSTYNPTPLPSRPPTYDSGPVTSTQGPWNAYSQPRFASAVSSLSTTSNSYLVSPPQATDNDLYRPSVVSSISTVTNSYPVSPPSSMDTKQHRRPQTPYRPSPLRPLTPPAESQDDSTNEPKSPPPPTRAAPPPPDLPPIPNPSEAIVVCDDCRVFGKTTTDVTCGGCRSALYMYDHVMNGGPEPGVQDIVSRVGNMGLEMGRREVFEMA